MLESDLTAGPTYRLFGIDVIVTNKLPQGTAVLADTQQIAVARDIAPSVTVLTERYAEYDQTACVWSPATTWACCTPKASSC